MEKEQLQAFLTLCRTRSFTKTAETLHIAQSTVTTRIQMLEQHLGQVLFKRSRRQVALTPAGKRLLPYAERIIVLMGEGESVMRMDDRYVDHVVIGSLHSLWDYVLVSAIEEFRLIHPQFSLRTITGHSDDIVKKMLDGVIDVGIVYLPPHSADIEVISLYEDHIELVGHSFALKGKERLTVDEVKEGPFVMMDWGSPFSEWFDQHFGKHWPGLQVDHVSMFVQILTRQKGLGFLLTSHMAALPPNTPLRKVPLDVPETIPRRSVYALFPKRKQGSPAMQAWKEFILSRSLSSSKSCTFPAGLVPYLRS